MSASIFATSAAPFARPEHGELSEARDEAKDRRVESRDEADVDPVVRQPMEPSHQPVEQDEVAVDMRRLVEKPEEVARVVTCVGRSGDADRATKPRREHRERSEGAERESHQRRGTPEGRGPAQAAHHPDERGRDSGEHDERAHAERKPGGARGRRQATRGRRAAQTRRATRARARASGLLRVPSLPAHETTATPIPSRVKALPTALARGRRRVVGHLPS